jgi:hypothetical protein
MRQFDLEIRAVLQHKGRTPFEPYPKRGYDSAFFAEPLIESINKLLAATLFAPVDLFDPQGLAQKLRTRSGKLSGFIWTSLSSSAQQAIGTALQSENDAPLRTILCRVLNTLLYGENLSRAERFADVTLSPEAVQLGQKGPKGNEVFALNRLHLETAYPQELKASPQFSLVFPMSAAR